MDHLSKSSPDLNLMDTSSFGQVEERKLKFAVVCSSNMNRSMEAHCLLNRKGFYVKSFGTGNKVKLPGPSANLPNMYPFSTSYAAIYNDLVEKDLNLYTQNGLLNMLERNKQIKPMPERFQENSAPFDVVICCEERVFMQVLQFMVDRPKRSGHLCHIINLNIQDTHEDAMLGAFIIYNICTKLQSSKNLTCEIEQMLADFEEKHSRELLHISLFF